MPDTLSTSPAASASVIDVPVMFAAPLSMVTLAPSSVTAPALVSVRLSAVEVPVSSVASSSSIAIAPAVVAAEAATVAAEAAAVATVVMVATTTTLLAGLGLRLVHAEFAPLEIIAIDGIDGLLGGITIRHLDEPETLRLTRYAVGYDTCGRDFTVFGE